MTEGIRDTINPTAVTDPPSPRALTDATPSAAALGAAAGKPGRWHTLGEAREIRRRAGMKVDF